MARSTAKTAKKSTPAKSAAGRPTKRTPSAQERILAAIRLGATYELAAKAGGITYDTFAEWRKNIPEFSEAVNTAEADACQKWLKQIDSAASKGAWQAAAWKLERRYPHMYGKTVQEHQGGQDIRISITRRDTAGSPRQRDEGVDAE